MLSFAFDLGRKMLLPPIVVIGQLLELPGCLLRVVGVGCGPAQT